MKNVQLILSLLFTSFLLLSSFIGYDDQEPPGEITFIGDAGSENVFVFRKWHFTKVKLKNDNFKKIKIELEINTSSLQTEWKDLEKSIRKKKDYFYVKKFPTASVSIDGATLQEDGSFTTDAQLTLKGVKKTVPLHFNVSKEKPYIVKGEGVINRRDFKFNGDGPKDEVPIKFEVVLPD